MILLVLIALFLNGIPRQVIPVGATSSVAACYAMANETIKENAITLKDFQDSGGSAKVYCVDVNNPNKTVPPVSNSDIQSAQPKTPT